MYFFEQSFGKADALQKTAQFFNPDNCKIKQNFLKRRRENSLPQQNLEAIKAIIQKTKMLQKNMISRKNTFHQEKENLQTLQSTKQSTKQSTQQSEDMTPNLMDINMKHSTSSQIVHNNLSFNSRKFPLITEYSSNNTNQIENNSRLSKASNSQERRRTIKVKDPYGIFKPVAVPRKYSSKSFINQKAQIKLVDRIFSSRSDSLQA